MHHRRGNFSITNRVHLLYAAPEQLQIKIHNIAKKLRALMSVVHTMYRFPRPPRAAARAKVTRGVHLAICQGASALRSFQEAVGSSEIGFGSGHQTLIVDLWPETACDTTNIRIVSPKRVIGGLDPFVGILLTQQQWYVRLLHLGLLLLLLVLLL